MLSRISCFVWGPADSPRVTCTPEPFKISTYYSIIFGFSAHFCDNFYRKNKKIFLKIFFEFLRSWGTTLCLKMFFRREIHCTDHFWFENEPSKVKPNFLQIRSKEFRVLSGVQPCTPRVTCTPEPLQISTYYSIIFGFAAHFCDNFYRKNKIKFSKIFFEFLRSWGTTLCLKVFYPNELH